VQSGNVGQPSPELGPAVRIQDRPPERPSSCPRRDLDIVLVTHHRHDADRSKSGKSKGAGAGQGHINAAAFNIGPPVRDRDRNGMAIFLVGDLNFRTKGQRFMRRCHRVIVERGTAGGFCSTLRRVPQGVHRCDAVFSANWNVEQTKHERRD
jgi:hypothetical protein